MNNLSTSETFFELLEHSAFEDLKWEKKKQAAHECIKFRKQNPHERMPWAEIRVKVTKGL